MVAGERPPSGCLSSSAHPSLLSSPPALLSFPPHLESCPRRYSRHSLTGGAVGLHDFAHLLEHLHVNGKMAESASGSEVESGEGKSHKPRRILCAHVCE